MYDEAKKRKIKMNTSEEIKIITDNFINANTGKIKSKVKNYYRSNTNLGYANGEGPTPNPQINIINNNHIYNNNIVKYSFFENRRKNVKVKDNLLFSFLVFSSFGFLPSLLSFYDSLLLYQILFSLFY